MKPEPVSCTTPASTTLNRLPSSRHTKTRPSQPVRQSRREHKRSGKYSAMTSAGPGSYVSPAPSVQTAACNMTGPQSAHLAGGLKGHITLLSSGKQNVLHKTCYCSTTSLSCVRLVNSAMLSSPGTQWLQYALQMIHGH